MSEQFTQSGTRTPQNDSDREQFTVLLSSTRRGARLARHLAVQQLITWNQPYDRAAHIVAELANNAVQHGHVPGRDFRLTLTLTPPATLRIEVTDTHAEALPHHPTPSTPLTESGRGLLLIESLSDNWGTELGLTPRKTVWAEVTLNEDAMPID